MRRAVDVSKHFFRSAAHFRKMSFVRTEDDIFSGPVFDMLCEYLFQSFRLFKRPAQCFEISFRRGTHRRAFCIIHPPFPARQIALTGIKRRYVYGRRQYPLDDRLSQCHFARDVPLKQFVGHIPPVVEITHARCGKAQQFRFGQMREQSRHPLSPSRGAAAMKFVKHDIIRLYFRQLFLGQLHEFRVCEKRDIRGCFASRRFFQVFQLRFIDIFAR